MKNMIPLDDAMLGLHRIVGHFDLDEKAKFALNVLGALDANDDSTISMIDLAEAISWYKDVFEQYVEEALEKEEADRHRLLDAAKANCEEKRKAYSPPF